MNKKIVLLVALSLFVSYAYASEEKTPTWSQEEKHAPQDAKPGSYEDWCAEHGVPESKDTRCSPALIPAFKATKDWCKDHGLPKSQDLKCNPNLKIVRPPKEAAKGAK